MKKKIISIVLCFTFVGVLIIIGTNNKEVDRSPSIENVINEKEEEKIEIPLETELEEGNSLEDAENKEDPMLNFWGYTGYVDECNSYNAIEFQDCDYDGDGLNDRLYKWMIIDQGDGNDAMYQIEFGNGDKLVLDRAVPDNGFPYIRIGDLTQNGENEIVFGCSYWTSTNPRAFGELAVFEKTEDGYSRVELPMHLSDSAYTMTLDFHYEKVGEQLIQVTCEDAKFSENIEIDDELWDVQGYKDYFSGATYNSCVWMAWIVPDEDGVLELLCFMELFDKWTCDVVKVSLRYQDGEYVYDDMKLEKLTK